MYSVEQMKVWESGPNAAWSELSPVGLTTRSALRDDSACSEGGRVGGDRQICFQAAGHL